MPRVTTPTAREAYDRLPRTGGTLSCDAVLTARLDPDGTLHGRFIDGSVTVTVTSTAGLPGTLTVTTTDNAAPLGSRVSVPQSVVARANRWMESMGAPAPTLHRDWHDKCHGLRLGAGQVRWFASGTPLTAVWDGSLWAWQGSPAKPAPAPRAARSVAPTAPAPVAPAPVVAPVPAPAPEPVPAADPTLVVAPADEAHVLSPAVPAAYRTPVVLAPVVRQVWRAYDGETVALVGPSGAGKTHAVHTLAAEDGLDVIKFDASGVIEPGDWFGTVTLEDGRTRFVESDLLLALRLPGARVLLIDEANRAALRAANALLPILDGSATFTVPQTGRTVRRNPDVRVVFTLNRGADFLGIEPLDRALSNRISAWIEVDDLIEPDEARLILDRCPGIKVEHAEGLARLARLIREASAQSRQHAPVSTRQVLAAAKGMSRGLRPEVAVEASILIEYSGEGGAKSPRAKVKVHAAGIDWKSGTGILSAQTGAAS